MDCLISCFPSLARYEPFSEAGKIREQSIEIVDILLNAEKSGKNLQKRLDGVVAQSTWTERLAKAVLNGLVRAIEAGEKAATAMADALRRAKDAAVDFACEHPAYTTLLALGVLVILAPWVIEALGFGELGPIEGSFAAAWQAGYAGYVPKGSLFSFFQRLGMIWHYLALNTLSKEMIFRSVR